MGSKSDQYFLRHTAAPNASTKHVIVMGRNPRLDVQIQLKSVGSTMKWNKLAAPIFSDALFNCVQSAIRAHHLHPNQSVATGMFEPAHPFYPGER